MNWEVPDEGRGGRRRHRGVERRPPAAGIEAPRPGSGAARGLGSIRRDDSHDRARRLPRRIGAGLLPFLQALAGGPGRTPGRGGPDHPHRGHPSQVPRGASRPAPSAARRIPDDGAYAPVAHGGLFPLLMEGQGPVRTGPGTPARRPGRRREPRRLRSPAAGRGGTRTGRAAARRGHLRGRPRHAQPAGHHPPVPRDGTASPQRHQGHGLAAARGREAPGGRIRRQRRPVRRAGFLRPGHGDPRASPVGAPSRGRVAYPCRCGGPEPRREPLAPVLQRRPAFQRGRCRTRRAVAERRGTAARYRHGPVRRTVCHPPRVVGRHEPGVPARGGAPSPGLFRFRGARGGATQDHRLHLQQRQVSEPCAGRSRPVARFYRRRASAGTASVR